MTIPLKSWLFGLGGMLCGCALFALDSYVEQTSSNQLWLHPYVEAIEFLLVGPGLGVISLLLAERVRTLRETAIQSQRAAQEQNLLILGRLAASVAHEVRNPLHTLRLVVDELRVEQPVLQSHPLSRHIDQSLERIDRAVDLVYQLARPGSHDDTAGDLITVLNEALVTVKHRSDAHVFSISELPKRALVRCPPSAMRIMIDNLLRNAVEATPNGTTIDLTLVRSDHQWVVSISNPGQLPEFAHQSASGEVVTSQKKSGLGLGLAITRHLASHAGGQVALQAQHGIVTARLSLPALETSL